jgi:hypothetical protein
MRSLTLALLAALTGAVLAASPAAATTGCPTGWGSLPEDVATMAPGEIDHIRTGRHECFDRVVVQVDGPAGGWHAAYVDQVTADGSGAVVPTPGGARIQLIVRHPWYGGPAVGAPVADVVGYDTLRSVVYAGSFEGQTTLGVGTRARLPFRVFALAGPGGQSRIVLDVARSWS